MGVKQYCIPLDSPSGWREALHGLKHTFGHTWENCYAMHLTTGLNTYLYCLEKDRTRIVCPFSERVFEGYVDIVKPFGFSGFIGNGAFPEFPDCWNNFVRERGYVCGYLGLNPIFDYSKYFDSQEVFVYEKVYVLDLKASIEELLANMSRGRRPKVNKLEQIRENLVFDKDILKGFFLRYYHDFIRSRNAAPEYYFCKETLSFLFNLPNVILVGIKDSAKVNLVIVFTYTEDAGEYMFNVSLPEGRPYSAALIWHAVKSLKEQGIPLMNLGGGASGIGEFKKRFGCKELPLRCLKQIYRQEIYDELCHHFGSDPNERTGYFPAYRQRRERDLAFSEPNREMLLSIKD